MRFIKDSGAHPVKGSLQRIKTPLGLWRHDDNGSKLVKLSKPGLIFSTADKEETVLSFDSKRGAWQHQFSFFFFFFLTGDVIEANAYLH